MLNRKYELLLGHFSAYVKRLMVCKNVIKLKQPKLASAQASSNKSGFQL